MYVKKFTSFCRALKEKHIKENWFLFFCLTVYENVCDKNYLLL